MQLQFEEKDVGSLMLRELPYGKIFQYDSYFYMKVFEKLEGFNIKSPNGAYMCVNLKIGTLRLLPKTTRIIPYIGLMSVKNIALTACDGYMLKNGNVICLNDSAYLKTKSTCTGIDHQLNSKYGLFIHLRSATLHKFEIGQKFSVWTNCCLSKLKKDNAKNYRKRPEHTIPV